MCWGEGGGLKGTKSKEGKQSMCVMRMCKKTKHLFEKILKSGKTVVELYFLQDACPHPRCDFGVVGGKRRRGWEKWRTGEEKRCCHSKNN